MENKNIATFIKIVEFNNFTRAAESLGYSQAAVTAQIKALESELGVPLFDRIGKKIFLTQEGKTFLPYAREMLRAEEEALNSVKAQGELKGELSVCSASSYASKVLPGLLLKFAELHPGVALTVKVSDYLEDNFNKLARGEIDFLVELEEETTFPDFMVAAVHPVRMAFVTHAGNPLLKKKTLKAEDVIGDRFMVADREMGYCALLEKELNRRSIELKPAMDIGSVEAIVNIMRDGYGTSFIPEYMAEEYFKSGELKKLNVSDIDIKLNVYYLCSKERWINPVMKEFIKMAKEL